MKTKIIFNIVKRLVSTIRIWKNNINYLEKTKENKIYLVKMMLNMMEQNKRKIIAMAMQLCVNSSSESESDDEAYRIAKKPKLPSTMAAVGEIPAGDLNLIKQFCVDLIADQRNFLRLDDLLFEKLLRIVEPTISKHFEMRKQTLSARECLILTLSYLSTGRNYDDLIFSSAKTCPTINQIVLQTCDDIYKSLRNDYMRVNMI